MDVVFVAGFMVLTVVLVVAFKWVPVPVTATMVMDGKGITKDWESLDNIDRDLVDAVIAAVNDCSRVLIVDECRRIVKLLEQVEQFGNLRPPSLKVVNIHDVLDRARQSTAVGFGAHMMLIEDYDPSLPSTLADADQLLQVFLNLLKNGLNDTVCRPQLRSDMRSHETIGEILANMIKHGNI